MPHPEIYYYIKNRDFIKKYEDKFKKEESIKKFQFLCFHFYY